MSTIESSPPIHTFYGQHRDQLNRLFQLVQLPYAALDSLSDAVAATQPWVKGDHARPNHVFNIDETNSAELHDMYTSFGLRDAQRLSADHYDHTLVLGGVQRGNNHRLEFLHKTFTRGDVSTGDIALLGGERRVYPESELTAIDENLRQVAAIQDSWLDQLRTTAIENWWETDLLRLAAIARLGGSLAVNHESQLDLSSDSRPHVQAFTWRNIPLMIMHTQAVERQGEPRHTTEACIADWLATAQPVDNARVAFLSANPHLRRMGRSAQASLAAEGRSDIELVVAGPAAYTDLGHSHYLGEIARHLYEDQRLLKTGFSLTDSAGITR
jgi:hypothetical protein